MSIYLTFLLKRGYLLLCLFSFPFLSSAALALVDPPVTGTLEGSGSPQDLALDYGSVSIPVPASDQLSFVYSYEGYSIDPESSISVAMGNSWYGDDSEVSSEFAIDHVNREISITLTRIDEEEIGGYGFVTKLKGIIVIVDEIQRVKANPWQGFEISAYFAADTETLLLRMGDDYGPLHFALYGLNGAVIERKSHAFGDLAKWPLSGIIPQIYILEMSDGKRVVRKKIAIGR